MRKNVTQADSPQDWVNARLPLHSSTGSNFWKHSILPKGASPWLGKPPNLITIAGWQGEAVAEIFCSAWVVCQFSSFLATVSQVHVTLWLDHRSLLYTALPLKATQKLQLIKNVRSKSLFAYNSFSDSALATNRLPNIVFKFILIFVCYLELLVEMVVIQIEYTNEAKCWVVPLKPYMIGTQLCTKHLLQVNPTNPVCLIQVGMLNMRAWISCFSAMSPTRADLHCKSGRILTFGKVSKTELFRRAFT